MVDKSVVDNHEICRLKGDGIRMMMLPRYGRKKAEGICLTNQAARPHSSPQRQQGSVWIHASLILLMIHAPEIYRAA
jgi:hypothetical protein